MDQFEFDQFARTLSENLIKAAGNLAEQGFSSQDIGTVTKIYGPLLMKRSLEKATQEELWQRLQRDIDSEIARIDPRDPNAAEALRELHKEMKDLDKEDHPSEDNRT